jgi:hypothetical protein
MSIKNITLFRKFSYAFISNAEEEFDKKEEKNG